MRGILVAGDLIHRLIHRSWGESSVNISLDLFHRIRSARLTIHASRFQSSLLAALLANFSNSLQFLLLTQLAARDAPLRL